MKKGKKLVRGSVWERFWFDFWFLFLCFDLIVLQSCFWTGLGSAYLDMLVVLGRKWVHRYWSADGSGQVVDVASGQQRTFAQSGQRSRKQ